MKKQFLFTLPVLSLLVVTVLSVFALAQKRSTNTTPTQRNQISTTDYRISGPYTHKNLTVFLVHGKDLISVHNFITLQEALAQKKVVVYETKDVNELAIKNLSDKDIYVQAGDIVRGGDQDRMISTDFIVPPNSGRMPIAAFCVESGRWSKRQGEVSTEFGSSENSVATKDLKLAAKSANSQQAVWENVAVAQKKLSENVGATVQSVVSASSLELSVENPKVKETTAAYINALSGILRNKSDVIGYAFAINGQVNSADVYASKELFVKLWPKLLKASAVEALAEVQSTASTETVADEAILSFLSDSEKPAPVEKEITQNVKLLTKEDNKNVFYETRDRRQKDAWVHRNYIRK